jgi:predicted dehydrogenase
MLKVGIIGAGFIAENHAKGLKQVSGAVLAGVVDKIRDKAEKMVKNYGGKVYDSVDDLLGDNEIDIVNICLPSHLHEEYAIKAANAKKHILLEKPISLSLESADRIIKSCKDNGIKLMVGQVMRFWPQYLKIKEIIESGELGDIKMVYACRLGQEPNWGDGWYKDAGKSGGVLMNLVIHDIDFLDFVFGPVESLYGVGAKKPGGGYEDVFVTFKHKNGVKALVDGSMLMTPGYPFTMGFRADGTKGTLEFSYKAGVNLDENAQTSLMLYREGKDPENVPMDNYDPFYKEIQYFVDCVAAGKDPEIVPPRNTREVLRTILSILKSIEKGTVIKL